MADERQQGIGEGPARAISVSLPEGTVCALREAAGGRGVSAVVAAAVEEYLRRQATLQYLAEFEQDNPPFTEEEKQSAAALWADAEALEQRWRDAG